MSKITVPRLLIVVVLEVIILVTLYMAMNYFYPEVVSWLKSQCMTVISSILALVHKIVSAPFELANAIVRHIQIPTIH